MEIKIKDPKMVARGKKNKRSGNQLEAKARAALTDAGYIICRWQNTVVDGKLIGAKPKWNFFTKSVSYAGTGFPDFVVMKRMIDPLNLLGGLYKVIGLECKSNGYLDPEERVMVKWYLDNKIFPKIIIVKKDKAGHMIFIDSQTKEELLVEELFN
jgi:hypothetical protein